MAKAVAKPSGSGDSSKVTKIITCDCIHEIQDSIYGKGNRVHNKGGAKNTVKWKCTVCNKEKK
jgi:hypothetical protein